MVVLQDKRATSGGFQNNGLSTFPCFKDPFFNGLQCDGLHSFLLQAGE